MFRTVSVLALVVVSLIFSEVSSAQPVASATPTTSVSESDANAQAMGQMIVEAMQKEASFRSQLIVAKDKISKLEEAAKSCSKKD